jgi:putative restriction endonuclease
VVLEISDYLGLTLDQARAQWRAMLTRNYKPHPVRQDNFTPVETLLSFGLALIGAGNNLGDVNVRESDPHTKQVAALARRTPGSIALKFGNLTGRRPNSAKSEKDLYVALTGDLPLYFLLYEVCLRAARAEGIEESELADFLGLEAHTLEAVLEADRVTESELRQSIDINLRDWEQQNPNLDIRATEKAMVGTARISQQQFARSVLRNCGFECVFCGLALGTQGVRPSRMLIAGHIKSWAESDNRERIDVGNGLAACPTHDAAFDGCLLTVSASHQVVLGAQLTSAVGRDPITRRNFGPRGIRQALQFPAGAQPPGATYLRWHNEETMRRAIKAQDRVSSQVCS